jgi:hypothetical protein
MCSRFPQYYQKAVTLLTESEAQAVAIYDDNENLRFGREKAARLGPNN